METYNDEDNHIYEEILENRLKYIGYTPKDYEFYMIKIGCKQEVSMKKGQQYILTNEEVVEMARIWETYGKPYINNVSI